MINSFKIKKIQTINFRNLEPEVVSFGTGINCIMGKNGHGKTNILEAVYFSATKKSFRKNTGFPQILSIDGEKPEIIISCLFEDKNKKPLNLSAKLESEKVGWSINGKIVKKRPQIPIVFINPFDSYSFHRTSAFRRNWFDTYIGQMDSTYRGHLFKYQSSLRFRNNLLARKPRDFQGQLSAIDEECAKYALSLTHRRLLFLKELEQVLTETFQQIFSADHQLKIMLDSKMIGKDAHYYQELMRQNFKKDSERGHTNYGVHKDDYVFYFDGMNSFEFCSLGQQKMSYLGLLFAYIELFGYKFDSYPIVLIDDVSGELDKTRWMLLVEYLEKRKFQVLITTANESFKKELEKIHDAKKIHVNSGTVTDLL